MHSNEALVADRSEYYIYTASPTAKVLFLYPIHLGYFYYEPGYQIDREHFDSFLLMLVLKGSCNVNTAEGSFTAKEGSVVLLDCYAPHQYGSMEGFEAAWIHFDGPMAREFYQHIHGLSGTVITPGHFQNMRFHFDKIYHIFSSDDSKKEAAGEPLLSRYLYNLLTELLLTESDSSNKNNSRSSDSGDQMDEIILYINEHFKEDISLDELAKKASLSPFYFTRLFTKASGLSPHQYLLATRISYAKYMLKSTVSSVKEIAFDCGFTSESSFCTAFRKYEGLTPKQYRNSK